MSYSEIIIALKNTIVDKVSAIPSRKSRRNDTSTPMQIGIAAKEDGESGSQEGDQRIIDLALQAVYKGTGKRKWGFGKGQNWNEKGGKGGRMEERTRGRRAVGRKEEKGKREVAREKPERIGRAARQDTLQLGAGKGETTHFYAFDKEQLPQRRTAHPSLFAFSDRHNQHAGVGLSTQVPGDCQTAVIFSGSIHPLRVTTLLQRGSIALST